MSLKFPDITIPAGAKHSNIIDMEAFPGGPLTIFSPPTLPETVKVYLSPTGTTAFKVLQSEGEDIVIPANAATPLVAAPCMGLRLIATTSVDAARRFSLNTSFIR